MQFIYFHGSQCCLKQNKNNVQKFKTVDRRKSCSGLCTVLVLYLFPGPLLRPKKSSNVFSEAIKDAQTTVLQCHVLVICFFTAQIMMRTGVLLFTITLTILFSNSIEVINSYIIKQKTTRLTRTRSKCARTYAMKLSIAIWSINYHY